MQSKSSDGSFFCDVLYGVRSACLFLNMCNDGFLFLLKNTVSSGRKERELSRKS